MKLTESLGIDWSPNKIKEALLHELFDSVGYGNDNIYHPDGTAIPVDSIDEHRTLYVIQALYNHLSDGTYDNDLIEHPDGTTTTLDEIRDLLMRLE